MHARCHACGGWVRQATRVVLTDGNETSMSCAAATVARSQQQFGNTSVEARCLDWTNPCHYDDLQQQFDVVLCADCCFFDEYRHHLVTVLATITRPSGHVVLICPERSGTRSKFIELAQGWLSFGMRVCVCVCV